MTKLYSFNMECNGHNIDSALTFLRLRWYEAIDACDYDAAERLQARIDRINDITGACRRGLLKLPYEDWAYLTSVSEWYKMHRARMCAIHGIPYVE
jgi:hypothetical protein